MSDTDALLEAHLAANKGQRMEAYKVFLSIPSVSALPAHHADSHRAAEWVADALRAAGLEHVEVAETGGNPIVYGDWLNAGPDAPTVIVYCHYDVQPVDPLDLWESPPFVPIVKGNRIQGRGSSDDKGQIMIHLAALDAMTKVRGGAPINLRYVFEGEEESSSVHLEPWLEANRDRLKADIAVISDTGFFDGNKPAITVGLRGITAFQLDVWGPGVDLHSGSYGGTVENPIYALAAIIAQLKGPDGRVHVPGFYDDVRTLSETDRGAFAALPFDEDAYLAETGSPMLHGEPDYSTLERKGGRPTLEINGIWGGFQGDGSKTIIPAHAHAKLTCRLVVDMEPKATYEKVRDYILSIAPPTVRVELSWFGGGLPSLTPIDHAATRAAATAIRDTFGVDPLYIREGGSIPVAASFEHILGLPVVLLGFTPPDDRAHSPNEYMNVDNYETGIRTVIRFFDELRTTPLR
jgi:acetylornithine deacetylase/succinyl-diaminopimelate desuccinylase-like protein